MDPKPFTLGGNVCVRDGIRLDYCWRECINSLLPVCETVVVCDGGSTDGTLEEVRAWCDREPKLRLCQWPWPNPVRDIEWFTDWLSYCREHVPCDTQIQLDADEVLYEDSYQVLELYKRNGHRHALRCQRLNFWRDHRSLIPPGVCLGHEVVRVAPQDVWLASDGAHPKGGDAAAMAIGSSAQIFHYGFLRRREAYFAKSKLLHGYFFGSFDPRLTQAETDTKDGGNWMEKIANVEWTERLVPYSGPHPAVAHQWLRDRGMEP